MLFVMLASFVPASAQGVVLASCAVNFVIYFRRQELLL